MSLSQQFPSFISSVETSQYDGSENMESVKNKAKEMLRSRIFLGHYIERRFINNRIGYRDIVLISASEVELKRDLLEAQYELRTACPNIQWIGITETNVIGCSPAGSVCLCTEIDNQPFGPFWFQIKSLKFREDEIIVPLKCLRHITDASLEFEHIPSEGTMKVKEASDIKTAASESFNETCTEIVNIMKRVLSIRNMKDFFTSLFTYIIVILTRSTAFVNFLGKLFKLIVLFLIIVMSILIKFSTIMFLFLLICFSKIVGGFFILLAMCFKLSPPLRASSRTDAYYDNFPIQNMYYDDEQFNY